jgi:hypothetical protein
MKIVQLPKWKYNVTIIIAIVFISFVVYVLYPVFATKILQKQTEGLENKTPQNAIDILKKDIQTRIFPFRYFQDSNTDEILPVVAVTGFFREESAKQKYFEYIQNGISVFGITAYKSFPKPVLDNTEGEIVTDFNYLEKIKDWLCCFNDPSIYGFTDKHHLMNMSESDFYDTKDDYSLNVSPISEKKYDFIYVCLKDIPDDVAEDYVGERCPMTGWNAINRNFRLAKACLPIMINEFGLKGLIVGRVNCGLEKLYGDKIEVTDMLEFNVLQEKMRQSKFLFVPNMYDASPRVVAECITKNLPVLMNKNILCGSKYITYETGELFNDEHDIRNALHNLLGKINKINPKQWWDQNYSREKSEKKLCDFLKESFPGVFTQNTNRIKFVL